MKDPAAVAKFLQESLMTDRQSGRLLKKCLGNCTVSGHFGGGRGAGG